MFGDFLCSVLDEYVKTETFTDENPIQCVLYYG